MAASALAADVRNEDLKHQTWHNIQCFLNPFLTPR